MKVIYNETEKRLSINLNKTIKNDKTKGIMTYGSDNLYPNIMENLILSSPTAKACAETMSKFIAGDGFENPEIGEIVIGKDNKGRNVTLDKMRKQLAEEIAYFQGLYVHCNWNLEGQITDTKLFPFKTCRFSAEDALGNVGQIAYHKDWSDRYMKKTDIQWFNLFTYNKTSLLDQIKKSEKTIENFKGNIYFDFISDKFLYPISTFDSVYLDMDTEYKIQEYKNNEISNGFNNKSMITTDIPDDEEEEKQLVEKLKDFAGPRGSKIFLVQSTKDAQGNYDLQNSLKIDKFESNIDHEMFNSSYCAETANEIRKSAKALPPVLIDYKEGTLSAASGEMIVQAVSYYNAKTQDLRQSLEQVIKDIYSRFKNEKLSNNTNWKITPTKLIE